MHAIIKVELHSYIYTHKAEEYIYRCSLCDDEVTDRPILRYLAELEESPVCQPSAHPLQKDVQSTFSLSFGISIAIETIISRNR